MTTYPNGIEFVSIEINTQCLSAYRKMLSGANLLPIFYLYLLKKIMHWIDKINMIIVKHILILSVYHERSDIKKKDIYFYLFINKRNIQWLWWHLITACMTFKNYVWHLINTNIKKKTLFCVFFLSGRENMMFFPSLKGYSMVANSII